MYDLARDSRILECEQQHTQSSSLPLKYLLFPVLRPLSQHPLVSLWALHHEPEYYIRNESVAYFQLFHWLEIFMKLEIDDKWLVTNLCYWSWSNRCWIHILKYTIYRPTKLFAQNFLYLFKRNCRSSVKTVLKLFYIFWWKQCRGWCYELQCAKYKKNYSYTDTSRNIHHG